MKRILSTSLIMGLAMNASASTVAIVDSGNDFEHQSLRNYVWSNSLEIANNDRDEDRNGYPDDINGWNFAESNNILIDYSYSDSLNEDTKRFFEIQLRAFLGTLTEADKVWYKEKISDQNFIKKLQIFGNWMHGTHVTGIALKGNENARAAGIKLIPTEVKLPGGKNSIVIQTKNQRGEQFIFDSGDDALTGNVKDTILMAALSALAKQSSKMFSEIGAYVHGTTKAQVLNGSFGTPYAAIEGIIAMIFEKIYKKTATTEELEKFTKYYFSIQLEEMKKFTSSAPNTLFVFAAGNDGSNNDLYPTSPANVQAENKVTVAATLYNKTLASFSNYGVANVDVAAPGVGIMSTIPMNQEMAVSGTSQAAPYVSNVLLSILDENKALSVMDAKKILLKTVDVKDWLKDKVRTSGIVNKERAIEAAILSRSMSVNEAISRAKQNVLDMVEENAPLTFNENIEFQKVLPLFNPIQF